jgi:hypothetical protein
MFVCIILDRNLYMLCPHICRYNYIVLDTAVLLYCGEARVCHCAYYAVLYRSFIMHSLQVFECCDGHYRYALSLTVDSLVEFLLQLYVFDDLRPFVAV